MPLTRYTKSGDVHIAYQVFGSGPVDLVLVPGFVSHVENFWDEPDNARWLLRLGSYARVAMFDKRGTGLSDRLSELPLQCLDSWHISRVSGQSARIKTLGFQVIPYGQSIE